MSAVIYACTTFGLFVFFTRGNPQLENDWSLSCDHGFDYAIKCENKNSMGYHAGYLAKYYICLLFVRLATLSFQFLCRSPIIVLKLLSNLKIVAFPMTTVEKQTQ